MKPRGLMLFLMLAAFAAPHAALGQGFTPPPPPSCTLTATPPNIASGDRTRLEWTSKNASRGTLPPVGNIPAQGSAYVTPSRTTDYVATFVGPGGTRQCVARVVVGPQGSTVIMPGTITPGTIEGRTQEVPGFFPTAETVIQPKPDTQTQSTAPGGGLVPQECSKDSVLNCNFCTLVKLIQNIINWLLTASVLVAAIMFAWAGVLYFTSAGNTGRIQRARTIFYSVGIGFLLVLGGWLFIQTLINAVGSKTFFSGGWSWNTIPACEKTVEARQNTINKKISDWLQTSLPSLIPGRGSITGGESTGSQLGGPDGDTLGGSPQGAWSCQTGSFYDAEADACYNPDTDVHTELDRTGIDGSAIRFNQYNGDINAAITNYWKADTSAGPDGGNKACAWAVNNILNSTGIPSIDGDSVLLMERDLVNGRGTPITDLSQAQQGDIIVWKDDSRRVSHVGFCADAGCTTAYSNRSYGARFDNVHTSNVFNGVQGRVYRVNR